MKSFSRPVKFPKANPLRRPRGSAKPYQRVIDMIGVAAWNALPKVERQRLGGWAP